MIMMFVMLFTLFTMSIIIILSIILSYLEAEDFHKEEEKKAIDLFCSILSPEERGEKENWLFIFKKGDQYIFELKAFSNGKKKCGWFYAVGGQAKKLTFRAMKDNERTFEEGFLKWSQTEAIWTSGKPE